MKQLTAEEASLLALLAQIAPSKKLKATHGQRIISSLKGDARKVAMVIIGDTKEPSAEIADAAAGFRRWAGSLKVAHG